VETLDTFIGHSRSSVVPVDRTISLVYE